MVSYDKTLIKKYSIYCNDPNYYQTLLKDTSSLEESEKIIIKDIKDKWLKLDNTWFITYLNKIMKEDNPLSKIVEILNEYHINITLPILKNILDKCPAFDEYLKSFFKENRKYTEEEIENKRSNNEESDILYTYALLKELIAPLDDLDLTKEVYVNDSVKMYLQQIGSVPKMSNEKKNEYFYQYAKLKALAAVEEDKEKKKEYENKVIYYRNKLTEANLKLVVYIARKYIGHGLDFLELIQEGNEGLMIAIDKFDMTLGVQLSTYAIWWIRQKITRSLSDLSSAIRVPVQRKDFYRKVYITINKLQGKLNRRPSSEEIAFELNVSIDDVNEAIIARNRVSSIDDVVSDEDDREKYELISDERALFTDDVINSIALEQCLECLDWRSEVVIRMRYGITDGSDELFTYAHTLGQVGKYLGLTRERVRQIEQKAIKKMQSYNKNKTIKGSEKMFWDNFKMEERTTTLENIENLQEHEKACLYARFGKYLDTLIPLESKDNVKAYRIVKKLQRMVRDPLYVPRNTKLRTGKNGPVITYKVNRKTNELEVIGNSEFTYEGKTLEEILSCTTEEKKSLIAKMHKKTFSYDLLVKVFGSDFSSIAHEKNLSKEDKRRLNTIIKSLKERKNNQDKKKKPGKKSMLEGKMLTEILNCDMNTAESLVSYIDIESETYASLILAFGSDLTKKLESNKVTNMHVLRSFIRSAKKKLESGVEITPKKYKYDGLTLQEIFGLSENFADFIKNIDQNSKIYLILKKAFGNDFLNPFAAHTLTKEERNILYSYIYQEKLSNHQNVSDNTSSNSIGCTILEFLDCTNSEWEILYSRMSKSGKRYQTLVKAFGPDLKGNFDSSALNKDEKIILGTFKYQSKNKIEALRQKQNSIKLSEEPVIEQPIIMESEEESLPVAEKPVEILTSEESIKMATPLTHPFFKELVKLIPLKYRIVTELRLGLYDGNIYDIATIALLFGREVTEVETEIEKGILLFKRMVEEYQSIYEEDFPSLDGETDSILKLIK